MALWAESWCTTDHHHPSIKRRTWWHHSASIFWHRKAKNNHGVSLFRLNGKKVKGEAVANEAREGVLSWTILQDWSFDDFYPLPFIKIIRKHQVCRERSNSRILHKCNKWKYGETKRELKLDNSTTTHNTTNVRGEWWRWLFFFRRTFLFLFFASHKFHSTTTFDKASTTAHLTLST